METDGADAKTELVKDMDVPSPVGVGNGRGGCEGGGDLHFLTSEHRCTIYLNKAHYGPVSGGCMATRSTVFEAVVATGGSRYIGYMGSRSVSVVGEELEGVGIIGGVCRYRDGELR